MSDLSYEIGSKYWNDKDKTCKAGFNTARDEDFRSNLKAKAVQSVDLNIVDNFRKAKLDASFRSSVSKRSASVILQDNTSTYRVKL